MDYLKEILGEKIHLLLMNYAKSHPDISLEQVVVEVIGEKAAVRISKSLQLTSSVNKKDMK
ncbi:MAG: hypothetical protein QW445_07395 [Candidatus Bathyarchaeia archaeon]